LVLLKVPSLAGLPLRIQQEKSAGASGQENHKAKEASVRARLGFRSIFPAEFRSDGDFLLLFSKKRRGENVRFHYKPVNNFLEDSAFLHTRLTYL
jgi:hypothetical protein